MFLEIVTPDQSIYSGDIVSAIFPGTDGSFGVQQNHAAIVSTLKKGSIVVKENNGNEHNFEVNGGIVEVNHGKIIVLAD